MGDRSSVRSWFLTFICFCGAEAAELKGFKCWANEVGSCSRSADRFGTLFFSFGFLLAPTKIGRYNSGGISMKLFLEFPFFSYFIEIGNNYFWKVDASYFYG